ncbi:MAG TPA: PhnD/SsuA/transferrin family substrate-binding protein [Acidiferrobacteraceae bacterium]|nr:PhnD/SsuA/transferrin family substrate-binding protein [Acidiferrobacteraceae bacterium]
MRIARLRSPFILSLLLMLSTYGATGAAAAGPAMTPAAYQPALSPIPATPPLATGHDANEYVFSAPPRGSLKQESAMYDPIANYLSRATGKKIVFRYASNWLIYSQNMTRGDYDLAFDGPHFNGWREQHLGAVPLVKIPDPFVFVAVTLTSNPAIRKLSDLVGRPVCAHAPPNLGTLLLLHQFKNPMAQPYLVDIHGWKNAYQGMVKGRCVATILPLKNLQKFEHGQAVARILYQAPTLPNQALSAGPRVSRAMRRAIRTALLMPEGQKITQPLRHAFASGKFVAATRAEYAGLGHLLNHSLYYQ